jgi:hypothetical protein
MKREGEMAGEQEQHRKDVVIDELFISTQCLGHEVPRIGKDFHSGI